MFLLQAWINFCRVHSKRDLSNIKNEPLPYSFFQNLFNAPKYFYVGLWRLERHLETGPNPDLTNMFMAPREEGTLVLDFSAHQHWASVPRRCHWGVAGGMFHCHSAAGPKGKGQYWVGKERIRAGGSGDGTSLKLCSLPGRAAWYKPPWFCIHSIAGTEPKRPIAPGCSLPCNAPLTLS